MSSGTSLAEKEIERENDDLKGILRIYGYF